MTYAFYTFFRSLDSTCNRAHVANTSINEVPTVEKITKVRSSGCGDMLVDRQTDTHTQTLITILIWNSLYTSHFTHL